jgi:hypothetical protein
MVADISFGISAENFTGSNVKGCMNSSEEEWSGVRINNGLSS